jgi:hypothetical protein
VYGFAAQYARARELGYQAMEDAMLDLANNANEHSSAGVNKARLQIDTIKWMLSKALPKRYGDKLMHDGGEPLKLDTKIDLVRPADRLTEGPKTQVIDTVEPFNRPRISVQPRSPMPSSYLSLDEYPFDIVRLACTKCERRVQYRKATLIERYGSDKKHGGPSARASRRAAPGSRRTRSWTCAA